MDKVAIDWTKRLKLPFIYPWENHSDSTASTFGPVSEN